MRTFWLGFAVGLVAGGAIVFVFLRIGPTETESAAVESVDAGVEAPTTEKKKKRIARPTGTAGDQPPPILTAADLKMTTEGDALRVRERSIDMSSGAEPRDLMQHEIDDAIAARSEELVKCVVEARGNAELQGRVTFGMVVTPSGGVSQARVEAPAFLLKNGLYRCARPKLLSIRYPAAGKDTVVRVSFDVE